MEGGGGVGAEGVRADYNGQKAKTTYESSDEMKLNVEDALSHGWREEGQGGGRAGGERSKKG